MKNIISIIAVVFLIQTSFSQDYRYTVDIVNVVDDKIAVELHDISWTEDVARFNFPKTIPGTYATKNYGVYIDGFKAYS